MTTDNRQATVELELSECWDLLQSVSVGRLAVVIADQPEIFPINFVVHERGLYFRSAAGTKLAGAVISGRIAFEVDGYEPHDRSAWSVVVKGRALLVEKMMEVFEAQDLPLFPWVASPKPDIVRIEPTEITGRRFHVTDEVAPDESLGWHGVSRVEHDPSVAVVPEPGAEFHPGEPNVRPD
jgi:nitroimidazol reductase NimA-like FMN-containing flavoprotein (pyridoxamine 5'-phosphate oxidase superfamily)